MEVTSAAMIDQYKEELDAPNGKLVAAKVDKTFYQKGCNKALSKVDGLESKITQLNAEKGRHERCIFYLEGRQ